VYVTAFSVFVADFFLKKYLANFSGQSIPLVKNLLHITVVFNKGAAFGILQGQTTLLVYTGIIFIIFFLTGIKKGKRKDLLLCIASGLILGGALSNLSDRIFLGYVVDYIDVRVWPVFNLSDSCISIGVFFLLIDSFRKNGKENHRSQRS
jgi:signal peptidase II